MRIQGAMLREQRVTFFVAVVRRPVLESESRSRETIAALQQIVGVPTVLVAQDVGGRPHYIGRRDLVQFLAGVPFERIPWKEYAFS